jgi:hypothetical protein
MARDDDQTDPHGQGVEGVDDGDLFAVMGAGGDDHRPVADGGAEAAEGGGVVRQRGAGELQIDQAVDAGAEPFQSRGRGLILRQDAVEGRQDLADRAGETAPARCGLLGDAGADQGQFHAARAGGRDQIGPQLALDEDAQRRLPVVEEGGDGARSIDRRELVDDARRAGAGPAGSPRSGCRR